MRRYEGFEQAESALRRERAEHVLAIERIDEAILRLTEFMEHDREEIRAGLREWSVT